MPGQSSCPALLVTFGLLPLSRAHRQTPLLATCQRLGPAGGSGDDWPLGRVGIVRLKFNGRLLARSPLSDLEELEMLRLGVEGKAAGWRTLRTLAGTDTRLNPARLDELIARARQQADLLEDLRIAAANQVIGHSRPDRPSMPQSAG